MQTDIDWLTGDEARRRLEELAGDDSPPERLVTRLRRELSAERTHLLVEQLDLRRRARAKFSDADRMYFTRTSLEQSTDERLAAWKAERIGARALVADLCAGIGGDALALARRSPVAAVERDPVTARLLEANARAAGARDLQVIVGDVTRVRIERPDVFPATIGESAAWHLDPDRRAAGVRTTHLDFCEPGPEAIGDWRGWSAAGCVKLAPATIVPAPWTATSQREWVETRGECRQQILWSGDLAERVGMRSATVVDRAGGPRTVHESPHAESPFLVDRPLRYVADARPAVLAAGLAGSLAAELDAALLGSEHGYLTSDQPRADAAWTQYETLDVLPFDRRRLKEALRERGWRQVVWKSRGVEVDLARLARETKVPGDGAGVVLITRLADRATAILARLCATKPADGDFATENTEISESD